MGKKKKSKAERREASQNFIQSRQEKLNGGNTNTQAGSLSETLSKAIDRHGGKIVAKAIGFKLSKTHQIASNPNFNMPKAQQQDVIEKLTTLEAS